MRRHYARREVVFRLCGLIQVGFGAAYLIGGHYAFGLSALTVGMLIYAGPWQARCHYNAGWLNGRAAMLSSMIEAQHRGMHPTEWLMAEAERDGVLSVRVTREDGEGLQP